MDYGEFARRATSMSEDMSRSNYEGEQLAGTLDAIEVCRKMVPSDLRIVLREAHRVANEKYDLQEDDYSYHRAFYAEVNWFCGLISAVYRRQGIHPIVEPRGEHYLVAGQIAGLCD